MSDRPNKMVDGVLLPLSDAEWQEYQDRLNAPVTPDPSASYIPVYLLRQRVEKLGMMDDFAAYLFQYPSLALKILSLESGVDPTDPNFSAAFAAMNVPQEARDYILAPASAGVPEIAADG